MRTAATLLLALLTVGCTSGGGSAPDAATPARTSDYRSSQLRQTALTLRVAIDPSAAVSDAERLSLPGRYEHALVEGLNERALVVLDVRLRTGPESTAAAAARATEVGADHAIVVEVRIEPDLVRVCEDTGRSLRGRATVLKQRVTVVRADDGAVRATLEVDVPAVEADCDARRPSARIQSVAATVPGAVERLLARLLRP